MKPIELDLLELFANDKLELLDFDHNKRMGSFIYSTWARWDVTVHILTAGDEGILSTDLCKKSELSQRGCNKIVHDMVMEGWVIHKCCTDKPCRTKYHSVVASPELKNFWSDYTEYWVQRLKNTYTLSKHI